MGWLDLLAGLVGQMQAPPPEQRFSYQVLPTLPGVGPAAPGARWVLENSGDISESSLDAVPWVDIGYPTQARDLFALTIGGHGGTSEGDAWGLPDIYNARKIVGSDMSVQPRHVRAYKQYLLDRQQPHFMSTHEGKAAY
jgi:hypothetical protein